MKKTILGVALIAAVFANGPLIASVAITSAAPERPAGPLSIADETAIALSEKLYKRPVTVGQPLSSTEQIPVPMRCGTPDKLELQELLDSGEVSQSVAAYIDAIAVLSKPSSWDGVYGYGHFTVFYMRSGEDAILDLTDTDADGTPDYIEDVGESLETAWQTMVTVFGFKTPATSNINVHIYAIPSGNEGTVYGRTGNNKLTPWEDLVIELNCSNPPDIATTTCAHELFHDIQFEYWTVLRPDLWIEEGTATWMEDAVFDEVNFYIGNLAAAPAILFEPNQTLTTANYASVLFWKYISEHYGADGLGNPAYLDPTPNRIGTDPDGVDIIRKLWQDAIEGENLNGVDAVNFVLLNHGTTFESCFESWTYVNYVKDLGDPYGNGLFDYLEDETVFEWPIGNKYPYRSIDEDRSYANNAGNGWTVNADGTSANDYSGSVDKWASNYIRLHLNEKVNQISISFAGADDVMLVNPNRFASLKILCLSDVDKDGKLDNVPLAYDRLVNGANDVTETINNVWFDEILIIVNGANDGGDYTLSINTTARTVYTVTLDAQGGTVSPSTQSYLQGTTYGTLPVPTIEGCTFEGWFTAGGTQVTADMTVAPIDHTLYARWWSAQSWADTENYSTKWYTSNTSATEFAICTAADLAGLAILVNGGNTFVGKTITLSTNIFLSGKEWKAIGTSSIQFQGIFDGDCWTIAGVTMSKGDLDYQGLFGHIGNFSIIRNVNLVNVDIQGRWRVGGIAGQVTGGTVLNCTNSGRVSGGDSIGGVAGQVVGGIVQNCINSASMNGGSVCGGVVGYFYGGTVRNCGNNGVVWGYGTTWTGGVVGMMEGWGGVQNCYNNGNINAGGGVVGLVDPGALDNCYNSGNISGGSGSGGVMAWFDHGYAGNCYYKKDGTPGFTWNGDGRGYLGYYPLFFTAPPGTLSDGGATSLLSALNSWVNANTSSTPALLSWTLSGSTTGYPILKPLMSHSTLVTFDANGGSGSQTDLLVNFGSPLQKIVVGVNRTHCLFNGYFDAAEGGKKYFNADGSSERHWDKTDSTRRLYAHWIAILAPILDDNSLTWETSESARWSIDDVDFCFGGSAARSGVITDNESSTLETAVTGPGVLSFYWKVSSEPNYDFLSLYVDDALVDRISGERVWEQVVLELTNGTHSVKFVYNGGGGVGHDCGWIDCVSFVPVQSPVTICFSGNGNTVGSAPATILGDKNWRIMLPASGMLKKEGFAFIGWNTQADGNGTAYTPWMPYTIPETNCTLYADWHFVEWTGEFSTDWYASDLSASTFKICKPKDLAGLAYLVNSGITFVGKTIVLVNDINLFGQEWTPIGTNSVRCFCGTFDGNGRSISGVFVNRPNQDNLGLFGVVGSGGTIQNLTLINSDIRGRYSVGGVAGYLNGGTIRCCENNGRARIDNGWGCGGIAGFSKSGIIIKCNFYGYIENGIWGDCVGGLVGENDYGVIADCCNFGVIMHGSWGIGGVVGYSYYGTVENCFNRGNIDGLVSEEVGGIAGESDYGLIRNCSNEGRVTGQEYVGGVVGYAYKLGLYNCFNSAYVNAGGMVGGVAGWQDNCSATNCYWIKNETTGYNWNATANGTNDNCSSFTVAPGTLTQSVRVGGITTTSLLTALNVWVETNIDSFTSLLSWTNTGYLAEYPILAMPFVSYDANGASSGTVPEYQIKMPNIPLKLAYNQGGLLMRDSEFVGWNTAIDGTGIDYPEGSRYTSDEPLKLYAKWVGNPHRVTFDGEGVAVNPASKTVVSGMPYGKLPEPTRSNYFFGGWWTGDNASGSRITKSTIFSAAAEQVLYAKWDLASEVLDSTGLIWTTSGNAGWLMQATNYYYGNSVARSGPIDHSQYSELKTRVSGPGTLSFFWKVSSESIYDNLTVLVDGAFADSISGTSSWEYVTLNIHGDSAITWVYAKDGGISEGEDSAWVDKVEWVPLKDPLSVVFSGNGSTSGLVPAPIVGGNGWKITLPMANSFSKTNHMFVAWNSQADGRGFTYDAGSTYVINASNVTLYAIWRFVWDGGCSTNWYSSNVTQSTFTVGSAHDLAGLAFLVKNGNSFTGKTVRLVSDISLYGSNWSCIGTSLLTPFKGTFDGEGHTIVDLTATNSTTSYRGLFGYAGVGCVIQNLKLVNLQVSGSNYVGGVAGFLSVSGVVQNCQVDGSVKGTGSYVGGVAGRISTYSSVFNCYNSCDVQGGAVVGGIVGYAYKSVVQNVANSGNIIGLGDYIGGVLGGVNGALLNSYNCGVISGPYTLGGLVGNVISGVVDSCYWKMDGSLDYGLSGVGVGEIGNCFSFTIPSGTISGEVYGTNDLLAVLNSWVEANRTVITNLSFWTTVWSLDGYPVLTCQPFTCNVVLNQCGGDGGDNGIVATYGLPMPCVDAPTRLGYVFIGYFDCPTGGIQYYSSSMSSCRDWDKSSSYTLYAQWEPIAVVVDFDAQGGTVVPSSKSVSWGCPYGEMPLPVFMDAIFLGWRTQANGKGDMVSADVIMALTSNHTLYAHWDINSIVGTSNLVWKTDGNNFWAPDTTVVKEGLLGMRSGSINDNATSWIELTVTGPGVLSFWWQVSSEGGYDFLTYSLNGIDKKSISGCKNPSWSQEAIMLAEAKEHTIRWTYSKDVSLYAGQDGGWLDGVTWITNTTTTAVPVPFLWLGNFYQGLSNETSFNEAAANRGANGHAVWESYVAGLIPTNSASQFLSIISVTNETLKISWTPDLSPSRIYSVLGKTNLADEAWGPANAGSRFFRVKVQMP